MGFLILALGTAIYALCGLSSWAFTLSTIVTLLRFRVSLDYKVCKTLRIDLILTSWSSPRAAPEQHCTYTASSRSSAAVARMTT